jgi:hypothetical protein
MEEKLIQEKPIQEEVGNKFMATIQNLSDFDHENLPEI